MAVLFPEYALKLYSPRAGSFFVISLFKIHFAFSVFCCIISLPKQHVNAILSLLAVCLMWHVPFWCFTLYPVDPLLPLPSAVLMRCLLHPAKPFLGWFECLQTSQGTMAALQGQALRSGSFHPLLNVTVLVSTWHQRCDLSSFQLYAWEIIAEKCKRTVQKWYKRVECNFPNLDIFFLMPTLFLGCSFPGTSSQVKQHCINHISIFILLWEVLWCSEMTAVCPFIRRINYSQLVSAFLNSAEATYNMQKKLWRKDNVSYHYPYIHLLLIHTNFSIYLI